VHGAVRWEADRRVLLGEDSTLGRPIWIELQPRGGSPPSPARRELTRATRPRWITGAEQSGGRWDAYAAPAGCSLADLAGPRGLPWGEMRPILEELAGELAAAIDDGTLPARLSVDQVWVQPGGGALLVDALAPAGTPGGAAEAPAQERSLTLLRQAAALGLEGGRRARSADPTVIQAPIPRHAADLLARLLGREGPPCESVRAFLADLHADADRPTEVGTGARLAHLGIQTVLHLPGLLTMFIGSYFGLRRSDPAEPWYWYPWVLAWPVVWVAWSALTRGGLPMKLMDLTLARLDGRHAGRLQCAWRSLLIWAAPTVLLLMALGAGGHSPAEGPIFWWLALATVPVSAAVAAAFPDRGPHDRLSGTYVVPL
jgi:hypothetical protein